MITETHGGEDVAIYAIGPGSDLIRAVMAQHVIFHVMMEASQIERREFSGAESRKPSLSSAVE